jgi:cytochrome b
MNTAVYPLWDRAVRAIHWLLLPLLPACWWTAEEGYMEQHQWLGLTVLVLVLTRLLWGFVGSPQARFSDFLRGPTAVLAYLRGAPAGTPGHNPLGGWSAMLLWFLLLAQATTGSFSADDVTFTGPFHYVFDSEVTDVLAELHELLFNLLLGFVGLHVAAVVFYERRRDQRLLRPMIFGSMPGREGTGPARPLLLAVVIAALLALGLYGLIQLAPEPPSTSYW